MDNDAQSLINAIESYAADIKAMQNQKAKLEAELANLFKFVDKVKENDYQCGKVSAETDTHKVVFTVSKKVTWDQSELGNIFYKIQTELNQNPLEYIEVSYNIPEKKFKAWPQSLSSQFESARTVSPSKPSIKVERKEAA